MKKNSARSTNSGSANAAPNGSGQSPQVKTCGLHQFTCDEVQLVRDHLLSWYDKNKRDLPWRSLTASEKDKNRRGYAVWVSEVMLQQTQVATVVGYYNKWMKKWPTLLELSRATLEEVNETWAGLGYYSRARRLHEGSKKVVNEMNGEMPINSTDLVKHLPGVGKYTAAAIASIAFNEPTGVVDGNVVRVLSRLRIIAADSTTSLAVDAFWKLVGELIDTDHPGDFNQAMMELGATVCTPKTPQCVSCPVKDVCLAYRQVESSTLDKKNKGLRSYFQAKGDETEVNSCQETSKDIEDLVGQECQLCLPNDESWNQDIGVCNYPRKKKLKEVRQEKVAVCILEYQENQENEESMVFICKRPATGLLAGLWEFPNVIIEPGLSEKDKKALVEKLLQEEFRVVLTGEEKQVNLGEVVHIFSHLHHTYDVQTIVLTEKPSLLIGESVNGRSAKWVSKSGFLESAVSVAMKKVFNLYNDDCDSKNKPTGKKRKYGGKDESRKQRVLESYFVKK